MAVAFAPEAFMDYVEQQPSLHEFANLPAESEILADATRGAAVDLDRVAGDGRREAVRKVLERVGQGNFRLRVLSVYDYCCALCDVQLDLVEAAHIVPVQIGGDNRTSNGLALCSLHHAAYDRALVGITPDYRTRTNPDYIRRLRTIDRFRGVEAFRENLRDVIIVPDREQDRPDPDALDLGLRIRGWQ
jgi:putative restriction endonuclease